MAISISSEGISKVAYGGLDNKQFKQGGSDWPDEALSMRRFREVQIRLDRGRVAKNLVP